MKWFWLATAIMRIISLLRADASKRKAWKELSEGEYAPLADRIISLVILAVAIWQLFVLWSPR